MFGEGGGRGTSMNSFLRSLSKTSTKQATSSSPTATKSVIADDPKVIGASFSHLNLSSSQPKKSNNTAATHSRKTHSEKPKKEKKKHHPFQSNIYMDSDDDWDADVDKSISVNNSKSSSLDLAPNREIGLYPAVNISASLSSGIGSDGIYSLNTNASNNNNNNPSSLILSHMSSQRNLLSNNNNSNNNSIYTSTHDLNETSNDRNNNKNTNFDDPDEEPHAQILRKNYKKIMEDPIFILELVQGPNISRYDENLIDTSGAKEELNASISRYNKFKTVLQQQNINLEDLKKLSWNGIPNELKSIIWQLLSGYLSTNSDRRINALQRKRKDYADQITRVMQEEKDTITWHQISIDIPRTNPHIKLYSYPVIQRSLERILYLWAVRHPASGYVQGINDICTPFFQVFLAAYVNTERANCIDIGDIDPTGIPDEVFEVVEADTYWCLTKLLDSIQDNYIHAQPGIIRQVNELKDLTNGIDSELVGHLEKEGIEFLQFSFRWMNCLLMRELNIIHIIRMWDTYLTEGSSGFSEFHVYVCAAFLVKWSDKIKEMDFQEIMIFLQSLPTKNWSEKDIELLLSEAYMLQTLYKNASAHLR